MSVNSETFDRIAELAKLEFLQEEKNAILTDMNRMLDFIEKLNELDTEGIDPLVYMMDESDTLRSDEAKQTISQKEALKNAPEKDTDFIKVPKVIQSKKS